MKTIKYASSSHFQGLETNIYFSKLLANQVYSTKFSTTKFSTTAVCILNFSIYKIKKAQKKSLQHMRFPRGPPPEY